MVLFLLLFQVWAIRGGLQLELEDRKSLGPEELQKAVEALLANYHNEPAVASMSSMYQADVPQYFLNIDRDKVQLMGLQLNQVFFYIRVLHGAGLCK